MAKKKNDRGAETCCAQISEETWADLYQIAQRRACTLQASGFRRRYAVPCMGAFCNRKSDRRGGIA